MHIHTNCICKLTFVVFAEKVIYQVLFALLSFYIYIHVYYTYWSLRQDNINLGKWLCYSYHPLDVDITYKHSSKTHGTL